MSLVIDSINAINQLALGTSESLVFGDRRFSGTFTFEGAQFTSGTGTDQVSKVSVVQLIIDPSSSTTLDLNTDFPDQFGNAQNFAKLKYLGIFMPVSPANTQSSGAIALDTVSQGFNQAALPIAAGDGFVYRKGVGTTVTGGSNDKLKFTNSDATNKATINVIVLGN